MMRINFYSNKKNNNWLSSLFPSTKQADCLCMTRHLQNHSMIFYWFYAFAYVDLPGNAIRNEITLILAQDSANMLNLQTMGHSR